MDNKNDIICSNKQSEKNKVQLKIAILIIEFESNTTRLCTLPLKNEFDSKEYFSSNRRTRNASDAIVATRRFVTCAHSGVTLNVCTSSILRSVSSVTIAESCSTIARGSPLTLRSFIRHRFGFWY